MVTNVDTINILYGFLEEDDLICRSNFNKSPELLNGQLHINPSLVPFMYSFPKLFCPNICFLWNSLCIFKWDFFCVDTKFSIIHCILACFGHNMAKIPTYKMCKSSYKGAHVTIKDSATTEVLRLAHSSLTWAIVVSINWIEQKGVSQVLSKLF
jgi:hypothetical protein